MTRFVFLFVLPFLAHCVQEYTVLHNISNWEAAQVVVMAASDLPSWAGKPRNVPIIDVQGLFERIHDEYSDDDVARSLKIAITIYPEISEPLLGVESESHLPVDQRRLCCEIPDSNAGLCGLQGSVITRKPVGSHGSGIVSVVGDLSGGSKHNSVYIPAHSEVNVTGIYKVLVSTCIYDTVNAQASLNASLQHSSVSPIGYLSPVYINLIPFSALLTVAYLVFLVVWAFLCFIHREEIIFLQHCISSVAVMGLLDAALDFGDYYTTNLNGNAPSMIPTAALVVHVVWQALARVLGLIVCMGYGTVRATLGPVKLQVGCLAFLYVVASTWYLIVQKSAMRNDQRAVEIWFVFPIAAVETIIYMWMYESLRGTMAYLIQKRQTIKLAMFQRFTGTVLAAIGLGAVVFSLQVYLQHEANANPRNRFSHWRTFWVFEAYWPALQFVITVAVAIIWRPNSSTKQFAYSEQIGQEMEDLEDGQGPDGLDGLEDESHGQQMQEDEDDDIFGGAGLGGQAGDLKGSEPAPKKQKERHQRPGEFQLQDEDDEDLLD